MRPAPTPWTAPGLRITALLLIHRTRGAGWSVSSCRGLLRGAEVAVALPFAALPRQGAVAEIMRYARRDRLDARETGILTAMTMEQ
jgi:hypothetical protein